MITLHGFTLDRVHDLARSSASSNFTAAVDYMDLYVAAHGAMIDMLLTADAPPTEYDLRYAGKAAIWQLVRDHRHTYGYRDREWDNGVGSAPKFAAYWADLLGVTASHETKVVERVALFQILDIMRPTYRVALIALAVCDGDRDAAAEALRINRRAFDARLQTARRDAIALWHQGETPSRTHLRRPDRRRHRGEVAPCGTRAAAYRHRNRREPLCELCAPVEAAYDRDRKARAKAAKTNPDQHIDTRSTLTASG